MAMQQYPLPVFHFRVEWGGTRIGFSEVTGLTPVSYTHLDVYKRQPQAGSDRAQARFIVHLAKP